MMMSIINATSTLLKYSLLLLVLLLMTSIANADIDHEHALYTKVLNEYVTEGRVDYKQLHKNADDLFEYLDQLATVSQAEFDTWDKARRKAFLINLYNAQTLKIVVENHPVRNIRMLGIPFLGPWSLAGTKAFGKRISLDHIEHGLLRSSRYGDPRIHFALVCAAKSCPPLRNEAYVATRLDEQLDDQGRYFMTETKKNRIDKKNKVLHLTSIMSFYRGDFPSGDEGLAQFVWPFFDARLTAGENPSAYRIRFTHYDWSINQS
jgi:hypothetical protein